MNVIYLAAQYSPESSRSSGVIHIIVLATLGPLHLMYGNGDNCGSFPLLLVADLPARSGLS